MLKSISGTWFEFRHHNTAEGKYWNEVCKNFTEEQWREKIREIASLNMKYIVLMCTALKTENSEECYFETDIFPQAQMVCKSPIEVLLSEAEKNGIKVFVSCGFYGYWREPYKNITSPQVKEKAFKAMRELYERYGRYKSFYGWYYPDETCIEGYFLEEFIDFVNEYSAYAHSLMPNAKTLIAPYGTNLAIPDEKYIEQLKRLDVDFVAYQDEVGVRKSTPEQTREYYKALKKAHDSAGRSEIWADIELFDFEDITYKSALIPADTNRVKAQLEAVSPYVEEILCYQYQGMVNKPKTKAYCGSGKSEELYNMIKEVNEVYINL